MFFHLSRMFGDNSFDFGRWYSSSRRVCAREFIYYRTSSLSGGTKCAWPIANSHVFSINTHSWMIMNAVWFHSPHHTLHKFNQTCAAFLFFERDSRNEIQSTVNLKSFVSLCYVFLNGLTDKRQMAKYWFSSTALAKAVICTFPLIVPFTVDNIFHFHIRAHFLRLNQLPHSEWPACRVCSFVQHNLTQHQTRNCQL